jgi:hypothetical protein
MYIVVKRQGELSDGYFNRPIQCEKHSNGAMTIRVGPYLGQGGNEMQNTTFKLSLSKEEVEQIEKAESPCYHYPDLVEQLDSFSNTLINARCKACGRGIRTKTNWEESYE